MYGKNIRIGIDVSFDDNNTCGCVYVFHDAEKTIYNIHKSDGLEYESHDLTSTQPASSKMHDIIKDLVSDAHDIGYMLKEANIPVEVRYRIIEDKKVITEYTMTADELRQSYDFNEDMSKAWDK